MPSGAHAGDCKTSRNSCCRQRARKLVLCVSTAVSPCLDRESTIWVATLGARRWMAGRASTHDSQQAAAERHARRFFREPWGQHGAAPATSRWPGGGTEQEPRVLQNKRFRADWRAEDDQSLGFARQRPGADPSVPVARLQVGRPLRLLAALVWADGLSRPAPHAVLRGQAL